MILVFRRTIFCIPKVQIQKLGSKRIFFLRGALNLCVSTFSVEFLSKIKILIIKQVWIINFNSCQYLTHGKKNKTNGLHRKRHSHFTFTSMHDLKIKGKTSTRLKPRNENNFKFALQGNQLNSRTNPLEEWENERIRCLNYATKTSWWIIRL